MIDMNGPKRTFRCLWLSQSVAGEPSIRGNCKKTTLRAPVLFCIYISPRSQIINAGGKVRTSWRLLAGEQVFYCPSAGCFTNVSDNGSDAGYDTIAEALMKCRDGTDLYVGQITFDIPSTTYASIEAELVVEARR